MSHITDSRTTTHITIAEQHMKDIQRKLKSFKVAVKRNETDWSHVGSVAEVASLLENVNNFLGGSNTVKKDEQKA